jgi:hypothetical protein
VISVRSRREARPGETISKRFRVTAQPLVGELAPVSADGMCTLAAAPAKQSLLWPLVGCAVVLLFLVLAALLLVAVRVLY